MAATSSPTATPTTTSTATGAPTSATAPCTHADRAPDDGAPFSRSAWQRTAGIRAAIDALPFLIHLADGTLLRRTFTTYLTQDAHYLADYARALAACATKADNLTELAFWAEQAAGAVVVERALHTAHVTDVDAVPPSPTCTGYVSFLLATAARGSYAELVAAVLPCYTVYDDVGTRLRAQVGDLEGHPYRDWIATYGDPAFAASTRRACGIADRLAAGADPVTLERMHAAYLTATRYEWMFWESANRHETWPV